MSTEQSPPSDTPNTHSGQLVTRLVGIDTYRENVVYLHRECPVYTTEGFQALAKVEIKPVGREGGGVMGVLNIVDDDSILGPGELGLGEQLFEQLGAKAGSLATVEHAEPPASLTAVHRKIEGEQLTLDEFRAICRDIVANRYSKIELAAFVVASSESGLERDESLDLTRAMIETGQRLDWDDLLVADIHCIGGVPGNRTSMIVVPIVAAHGTLIPKTSSRAITSPAGTADTMEMLAEVEIPPEKIREIVGRHRGCIVWGGTARLAPVDDVLISVERPLALDSKGQMVASILSKKISAGSTHLLIDIPVGPSAKVRSRNEALRLRKLFEYVADKLGLHLETVLTDGSQPVGRGIGPVLEVRDVMQVLRNEPEAPLDLREHSLRLAGRVIEFDPDVRGGQGLSIARDILESGRALDRFERIVEAQGPKGPQPSLGHLSKEVVAPSTGKVTAIDNYRMARIARRAGAPFDSGAGVDLHRKVGDSVQQGEPLYTVYSCHASDFRFALTEVERGFGYTIDPDTAGASGT
jgi:thymidine phosphorylase